MLRKSRGSIFVFSTVAFTLVVVISLACSSLILNNSRYSKYNYKSVCMEEVCYSDIELIYSKMLEVVENILDNSSTFEEFEASLLEEDFINKISIEGIKNSSYSIATEEIEYQAENSVHYRILVNYQEGSFEKSALAIVKIENPFEKVSKEEGIVEENTSEGGENLETQAEDSGENQEILEEVPIEETTTEAATLEEVSEEEENIDPRDIVKIIFYKEG